MDSRVIHHHVKHEDTQANYQKLDYVKLVIIEEQSIVWKQ